MADKKNVTVRFYLDKPLHGKTYEFLKSQTEFPTISAAVITAVNNYFDNQAREDRLVEKIVTALAGVAVSVTAHTDENDVKNADEVLSDDIDFDFLGG